MNNELHWYKIEETETCEETVSVPWRSTQLHGPQTQTR